MLQLIAFIIFVISAIGISVILVKKAPELINLPKNGSYNFKKNDVVARVEGRLKDFHFHFFSKQMLLHKILSFVKVWTLKAEVRIDHLLHGIRRNAQEMDRKVRKKK